VPNNSIGWQIKKIWKLAPASC